MIFKALNSAGRVLHSVKGKLRNDVKTTWALRDSAVVLSTVAQPLAVPLPRLPVPTLQQTFQKYLRTVKPLVTDNEYTHTEKLVKEFISPGGIGEKLQFLLEEKARNSENWLSDWWLHAAYLDYRSPLVPYSNPGLVLEQERFNSTDDQIRHAARIVSGALNFKEMIDQKRIPSETLGGKPLDMSQHFKLLSTCRIPGVKRDSVRYYGLEIDPPTHIVVICNNHFFKLEVYAHNNEVLSEKQIEAFLREIFRKSAVPTDPVGILTADDRDKWGQVYNKLIKDKNNKKTIEDIQRSIFILCLDGRPEMSHPNNGRSLCAMQLLHGCGSTSNSGNRWFDKTVQLIVGRDGTVGMNYEHSPAEGPPIANLMDHIVMYLNNSSKVEWPAQNPLPPRRLPFNVTDEVKKDIAEASVKVDKMVQDVQVTGYEFKGYGKGFIKSQKLSPDSYIQMAIQLAFYRLHKKPVACYESASTRQYIHGRTETIRSTSLESLAFCKAMLESQSNLEKVQSIRKAVEHHKKYVADAVTGYGVDRHLLGLKLTALENGIDVPRLFLDSGYTTSNHFRLSTSQVSGKGAGLFMIFGAVVEDGYGICYNPSEKQISFGVTSYYSCPETNSERFRDALQTSLSDMHNVLVMTQTSKL